jgi:hypothetical protein
MSSSLGFDLIPNNLLTLFHEAPMKTLAVSNAAMSNWIRMLPEPGSRYGRGAKCIFSPIQQLDNNNLAKACPEGKLEGSLRKVILSVSIIQQFQG